MGLNYNAFRKINEGKTKVIYENPDDVSSVYMVFKDDITAGDGVKHDVIEGKARVDWQTNKDIFEYLNRKGIRTHYIDSPEERVSLVKKLDRKIDLEVVTRRVAAGSILKWNTDIKDGDRFDPLITQFHYKDDSLHDPMLDAGFVDYIIKAKNGTEFIQMKEINSRVFKVLEDAFARVGVQLIDFKLEYGIIDGAVTLIDEITGGSFRLWPFASEKPDLQKSNVLSELNPAGRLDKDNYRMGGDLQDVQDKFQAIAQLTQKFAEF